MANAWTSKPVRGAGFNSVGIASAVARENSSPRDARSSHPRPVVGRYPPVLAVANNLAYLRERATECWTALSNGLPNREFETVVHAQKPCTNGWRRRELFVPRRLERPNWLPVDAETNCAICLRPANWFDCHAAEHRRGAKRSRFSIKPDFQSSCQGSRCRLVLQRLCGNNVDVPVGQAFTQAFLMRARNESDLTVIRLAAANISSLQAAPRLRATLIGSRAICVWKSMLNWSMSPRLCVLGIMGRITTCLASHRCDFPIPLFRS